MKTLKQLEKARDNAERRAYEWYCEYENELENFFVKDGGAQLFPLNEFYRYHREQSIADIIETDGVIVYEENDDSNIYSYAAYKVCTRRAVKRLRYLERKIKEWNDKYYYLDCAVESWDEEVGLSEDSKRELAALGFSI